MTLHGVKYVRPRNSQNRGIIPLSVCDEMVHRLVPRPNVARIYQGCHRFNTLSLAGQQQTRKIGRERLTSVSVVDKSRNFFDITLKSDFSGISERDHAAIISQSVNKIHYFMTQ